MKALSTISLLALLMSCSSSGVAESANTAPDKCVDMNGMVHDLTANKSVLVFWQPWCASCFEESPRIRKAVTAYPEFSFLGVISGPDSAIDDSEVRTTTKKWKYDFPQIRDRDLSLTNSLNVTGTPTIVVLNADGSILYRGKHLPDLQTL